MGITVFYLLCLFILYRKNSMKNILLVQECHINGDQITSDGYGMISLWFKWTKKMYS